MKPSGHTFVISGGCSGLGLATALDLHRAGGYVSLLDLNAKNGERIIKELGTDRARFFETYVSDTKSLQVAVQGTVAWVEESSKPLAGVIAAAGVGGAAKVKNEPLTADGERGVLIMVSSSAAFDGQPGQVAYSASKGAIASLTLPLARDLARHGIRAVTIAPSLFDSAMTRLMPERAKKSLERTMEFPLRAGKPEEFSSLVMQSIENSMLNGTVLRLDGAMRMPSRM